MSKCSSSLPMKVPVGRPRRNLTTNPAVISPEAAGLETSATNVENAAKKVNEPKSPLDEAKVKKFLLFFYFLL